MALNIFWRIDVKPIIALIAVSAALSACGTQQPIEKAFQLSPGMSKQDVIAVMGNPAKNEFDRGVEEWHYCKTGQGEDEMVAVFFSDGEVIAMKPYTVTLRDAGGATGSCEKFVKMGNYREPSSVREYRVKFQ